MTLDLAHPIAGKRYRHRKGGIYTALGTAKVQTDTPLADYAEVVVYQAEDAERSIWVRPVAEFTDGRFTGLPDAAIPSPNGEFARPMETAPRDNTIVRLLVEFEAGTSRPWLPLTDDARAWTIGSNSFDHTDDDVWQFVGWSWSQDCFVDCHAPEHGKVVGWLPFYSGDASGAERDSLRGALSKVLQGIGVAKLGLARDGVQHAKLEQLEIIASAALKAPAETIAFPEVRAVDGDLFEGKRLVVRPLSATQGRDWALCFDEPGNPIVAVSPGVAGFTRDPERDLARFKALAVLQASPQKEVKA